MSMRTFINFSVSKWKTKTILDAVTGATIYVDIDRDDARVHFTRWLQTNGSKPKIAGRPNKT